MAEGITGHRTKARKRALDILFEVDLCESSVADSLALHAGQADPPLRPYTVELVEGVESNRDALDARIAAHLADDWTIQRMPRVDRNLARIAVYEMCHGQVEPAVAIAEAVDLAGGLSTDSSPAFLNGVLSAIAKDLG
ncbi:MAG: transcription antitermination factor NusB [Propionibacteriaceae bacterium]|nr:transcription antitermination factor NusB [Propionibacteriaceae bacterium]